MPQRRTYLRSVVAVATGATLAGCSGNGDDGGGSGEDGGGGSGGAMPTATPAAETTSGGSGASAQDEYPDYNWDKLDGTSASEATTVEMAGFSYDPLVTRVPAGEAITFPNTDSVPHTVTAPAANVDVEVQPGEEGSVTIDEPGTYDYVCRFHPPEMLGRLVVEEGLEGGSGMATPSGALSTDTGGTPTPDGGGGAY